MSGPAETTGGAVWSSPAAETLCGTGPTAGGKLMPTTSSTAWGTSGSVNTHVALASTVRARVVSRLGSPGPEPTNVMFPGFALRPRPVT